MTRAFVFPGQGSQRVGMGRSLVEGSPLARDLFALADETLGFPLSRLCFEGPEEDLQLTANTQPAILTVSVAAWHALLERTGWSPSLVAGHSLGEYSALVCAGSLRFVDALRLVHLRGRAMQEAVPAGQGTMAAIIGLAGEVVAEICRDSDGECSPANYNGAGQVVVAGTVAAVELVMELARRRGAKLVKLLPVSAPFHCRLMAPAAERLRAALCEVAIERPSVAVVTNVRAEPCDDPAELRELLVEQVTAPVRWEESVRCLAALGVDEVIEIGPGRVLSALVRRIVPGTRIASVEEPGQIEALAGSPK